MHCSCSKDFSLSGERIVAPHKYLCLYEPHLKMSKLVLVQHHIIVSLLSLLYVEK